MPRNLKKSLLDLGDFSAEATRRLDETYYSVLEKLSVLQTSIIGLQDLALRSRKVTEDFQKDSNGLVKDIQSQISSLSHVGQQRQRIDELQGRVQKGMAKVAKLSGRVDVVMESVGGWERADTEWQESTRRRLKVIWAIMSVAFFGVVLLFVSAQYSYTGELGSIAPDSATGQLSGSDTNLVLPAETVREAIGNRNDGEAGMRTSPARSPKPSLPIEAAPDPSLSLRSRGAQGPDKRLIGFDEL